MTRRTESEWRQLFHQHKTSGLTAKAFCLRQGIHPKTFSLRRIQILGKKPANKSGAFIKAVSVDAQSPASGLTLRGAYGELQFPEPPSPEWLGTLLKQLT